MRYKGLPMRTYSTLQPQCSRVVRILPLCLFVVSLISRKGSISSDVRGSVKIRQLPTVCHRPLLEIGGLPQSPGPHGSPARGARVLRTSWGEVNHRTGSEMFPAVGDPFRIAPARQMFDSEEQRHQQTPHEWLAGMGMFGY